ncbi:N-acetylneuraminate synthase [Pontibacter brevis]
MDLTLEPKGKTDIEKEVKEIKKMTKTLIIAEAGVNHNGSIELAKKLVDAAVEAGADIVKFQTFKAEKVSSKLAAKAEYQKQTTGEETSQLAMLKKLELTEDDHDTLISYCSDRGIFFLSTPFDLDSILLLKEKGIRIGKIPSGEITNLPYIEAMSNAFPEIILSTGMATIHEVASALSILLNNGTKKENITILHCNTEYPTPMQDVNLRAMLHIKNHLEVKVGYSDHTLGIEVPIAAVALGGTVIEKHFTLDKNMEGPDHRASLEPAELTAMVKAIRNIEQAMSGSGVKEPSPSEKPNISLSRRSIHLAVDVKEGDVCKPEHLIMKRPGDGISPMEYKNLNNKTYSRNLETDHKLDWNDFK